ncbi:putative colanic acid biosynthesis acetyltransferase [Muricoccus radiodurans]|uniref:putative colanic acid biosynthesis acetyltransferase n=1 Tax=Muricoccus radiodurans TaxID=2231721 RepID=UPI003CF27DB8
MMAADQSVRDLPDAQAQRPASAGQEPHRNGRIVPGDDDGAFAPPLIQDLARSKVPPGFRGRSAVYVQLWWIVQALLVHPSPQVFYGWRRFLLRCFGARIGKGVLIRPSVQVTYPWKVEIGDWSWVGDDAKLYSLGPIKIGRNAVVSQGSHLCAGSHDHRDPRFTLIAKPITIEDQAWVAADAFIAMGVTVGAGAIVGARSVVLRNVPPMVIACGFPARVIGPREMGPRREEEAGPECAPPPTEPGATRR